MRALEGTHTVRMMHMLGLLIVVFSVTLCDAQCWLEKNEADARGCVDKNGVLHKFNTKWRTKDCYRCTCTKEEIECCSLLLVSPHAIPVKYSTVFTPVDYDKKKCERIFYEDTCSYTVVEKADPSKHCEVRGIVG